MIREASEKQLGRIAEVHAVCFPNSFSTKLGEKNRLLECLYKEYLKDNPELFLVAVNKHDEIIGFCMGYYCEKNNHQRMFLKNNFKDIFLRMAWLLISGNRLAWRKMMTFLKKDRIVLLNNSFSDITNEQRGDLLSICVLPEYRGKKVANALIEHYENILRQKGRKLCLLTVENENERGVGFYKKNGYIQYQNKGYRETTYCKIL